MAKIKPQFTLRMDLVTHVKMKKIAEAENRSLTQMIEYLCKKEIKRYEEENGEVEVTDEDLYLKD